MNKHNWFDFGYQSGSCSVCPLWIHCSEWDCWYRVPLFNDKTSWSLLCVSTPGYGPGQSPVKISNIIWQLQNRLCSKTARGSVFFCCLLQDFMWFVTNLLHRTWLSPSYRGKHIQGQHFGLSSLMHFHGEKVGLVYVFGPYAAALESTASLTVRCLSWASSGDVVLVFEVGPRSKL